MVKPTVPPLGDRERACMIVENGHTYCVDPLEGPLQVISRRWALLVVGALGNADELRFSELKRAIPGISGRALSTVLKDLGQSALVEREVVAEASPPAVTYRLTRRGEGLRAALIPLVEWASDDEATAEA